MLLTNSVGQGGINRKEDVFLVQRLLNDAIGATGQPLLKIDGLAGPKTVAAIKRRQQSAGTPMDGRVDPHGPTFKKLVNDFVQHLASGVITARVTPTGLPQYSDSLYASALSEGLAAFSCKPS